MQFAALQIAVEIISRGAIAVDGRFEFFGAFIREGVCGAFSDVCV